jgi:aminoglycoside phosphotransferase
MYLGINIDIEERAEIERLRWMDGGTIGDPKILWTSRKEVKLIVIVAIKLTTYD